MASQVVSKLVKPPINLYGIEGRYVNALYSAASKSNKLQVVEGDLKRLAGLYKTDPKFKEFMVNPLINPVQKSQIFEGDLKNKLKLSDVSVRFLSVMSENRRLKSLPEVENYFSQIMSAIRQELPCWIKSAKPLDASRRTEIENSLKDFTKKKLVLDYEVDPSLLGGLTINFNNEYYIDMSIKSKIQNYQKCCSESF